jgi:hypothetical protein
MLEDERFFWFFERRRMTDGNAKRNAEVEGRINGEIL